MLPNQARYQTEGNPDIRLFHHIYAVVVKLVVQENVSASLYVILYTILAKKATLFLGNRINTLLGESHKSSDYVFLSGPV